MTAATPIQLPPLPYAMDALAPTLSYETVDFHYNKHHTGYVNQLNQLLSDPTLEFPSEHRDLVTLIRKAPSPALFNQAAQVWNHTFYWESLSPQKTTPNDVLMERIEARWDSFEAFKRAFAKAATQVFGSGWAWLVQNQRGELDLVTTSNANNPLIDPTMKPLLTCDVWEHAYYIDYRNARARYVEALFEILNWDFANHNLQASAH